MPHAPLLDLVPANKTATACEENSPCTIVIIVAPAFNRVGRRLTSRFDAFHDEQLIVQASKTPFLDAARKMLALGFAPETNIVMRHRGDSTDSLRARICDAARLTVAEGDRAGIHFQRWKPFPSSAVEARIARMREAGVHPHLDSDDASLSVSTEGAVDGCVDVASCDRAPPHLRSSSYGHVEKESY